MSGCCLVLSVCLAVCSLRKNVNGGPMLLRKERHLLNRTAGVWRVRKTSFVRNLTGRSAFSFKFLIDSFEMYMPPGT